MASEKKKSKGPKPPTWSAAFLWAAGQWAVCWFVTQTTLWDTVSATAGAFASGWVTASLAGRLAKLGLGAFPMMVAGLLLGTLVYSGAATGLSAVISWWKVKNLGLDWEKLQAFLMSSAAVPPAVLGLVTGLYVRAGTPLKKK
jgi:hypothetical protein